MAGTRGRGRQMRFVWLAGALLAALAVPSVALATPSAPSLVNATVKEGANVELTWAGSTDPEPGTLTYQVYRDDVPMTITTYLTDGTPVGSPITVSPVTVTAAFDEATKKFTYYYAIVATNGSTEEPSISTNVAPNVHGGLRSGMPTLNCQLCHSVHGAGDENYLGAATRYKCYRCHGNTDAATSYGDMAIRNVQKDFYDYTEGQTIPPTVSRHYNSFMEAAETECTSCHTPHKSPYYVNPLTALKDDTLSYTQLLRVEHNDATYFYSRDSAVAGNAFCFECHGGSGTTLDFNAGAGAYDRTGGDHTYATDAAHNTTSVYANGLNANPAIQCEACHNKHASAADKLIAYRGDDTKDATTTYAQAELCYACHSAAGYAAEVAAGTATGNTNFAWNGRDVQAQFGKASRHPTTVRVGDPVAVLDSWAQTTQADFQSDALTNAVATAAGSVELEPAGGTSSTIFSDGFESGDASQWDSSGWGMDNSAANAHTGSYSAVMNTTGADELLVKTVDTAGRTNVQISFWLRGTNTTEVGDYIYLQVYNTGTSSWDPIRTITLEDRVTSYRQFTDSIGSSYYAANMQFRILGRCNMTDEYQRVDDVMVTADPLSGSYVAAGTAVSTAISPAGTLGAWGALTYNPSSQPAGTSLTVDVLDASDDSVLISDAASGANLSGLSASSLKLRANLNGNAGTPQSWSDNFNDNSFDTASWTDLRLNGSTDADDPSTVDFNTVTFAAGLIDATTGMDSRTPDNDGTGWYSNNNNGSDGNTAGYARTGTTNNSGERIMLKSYGDLSTYSGASASFDWRNSGAMTGGDYLYVEWSTDGGSTWTTIGSATANNTTWTSASNTSLPVGTDCLLRVRALCQSGADDWRVDAIAVSATKPATDDWPKETGGQLQLRAEGPPFDATNGVDEGEFLYVKPAVADWVDTEDFDLVVKVADTPSPGAGYRAGLMIRAGSNLANAEATGASMAGVYVTNTNVIFEYRTTAGTANTSGGNTTGSAPEWLKLERRGTMITAKSSDDGSSWTTIGSGTMTIGASDVVLAGMAITSGTNGTFAEGTWDDFSITEAGITATATPALLDWTVSYTAYPPVTTGSLTCVNCHNVHSVQKGAVGTAWQVIRASLPSNTKTDYAGTPAQFCLECHDGTAPTTTANSATVLVPYTVEFSDKSSYLLFPGWNKTAVGADWAGGGHASTTLTDLSGDIGCDTCHDPHASDNARLTAYSFQQDGAASDGHTGTVQRNNTSTYAEEKLCYACHTTGRMGNCNGCHGSAMTNLMVNTPFAATYRHPVEATGRHSDLETGTDLGPAVTDRHAECADCHDPHATRAGVHPNTTSTTAATKSSNPGDALRGATGIKPVYGVAFSGKNGEDFATMNKAASFTSERMTGETTDFEAYVCLKCHSSYSGQPFSITSNTRTYTSTDLALEFNPSNQSEHNVFGQTIGMEGSFTVDGTTYEMPLPADSAFLKTGWTHDSPVTCTDCHTNTTADAARGPHGSSTPWMIATGYRSWSNTTNLNNLNTAVSGQYVICTKCHQSLSSSNSAHNEHNDRATCWNCHISIPHGWKRPRLLVSSNDPTYLSQYGRIGQGIALRNRTGPNDWRDESVDCAGGCDNRHNYSGTFWP